MGNGLLGGNRGDMDTLIELVPEVKFMIGFPQNHPHHHLDVWEHTKLALSRAPEDRDIRVALLLHDIGKPFSFQDEEVRHFRNHAKMSTLMSTSILRRNGVKNADKILRLIEGHDTPIESKDIAEDFDYCKDLLVVQYCDALAHNPTKLAKRINYIQDTMAGMSDYAVRNGKALTFPDSMYTLSVDDFVSE